MLDHVVDGGGGFGAGCSGAVGRGMVAEIVGGVEGEDALIAFYQQEPFEQAAALIVEEIFVPLAFGEFGDDDDDAALGLFGGELKNVLNDRHDHEAIRRRKSNEFRRRIASGFEGRDNEMVPFPGEDFGMFVGLDVNGDDVGGEARG